MELKLNIYKNRKCKEIEKTLTVNDFELSTGACEDILKIVNIDIIEGVEALSEETQTIELIKMITQSFDVFRDLLKDVFDDLTDEDIKRTKMSEIASVILSIVKYSLATLFSSLGGKQKN